MKTALGDLNLCMVETSQENGHQTNLAGPVMSASNEHDMSADADFTVRSKEIIAN